MSTADSDGPSRPDLRPGLATRAIHAGQHPDPVTGAVIPPIYQTSTYVQESPAVHKGYVYARGDNATRQAYERCIAGLEGAGLDGADGPGEAAVRALAFASGMAATATLLEALPAGAHVIASADLYGGSYRLFERVGRRAQGLSFSYVDMRAPEAVEAAIGERTALIWIETPTNPLLQLADLDALAEIGRRRGVLTCCDNTFATPALQRPLSHGIDVVMHSATKYIGGHSDMVGGLLVAHADSEIAGELAFLQNAIGAIPGPFDAWLGLRGAKTLPLRMAAHGRNAAAVAAFLEAHEAVTWVIYPGLDSHPQRDLARRQMATGGGMVTASLAGGMEAARRMLERVEIFALAESLGGVESLIEHPASMTHASIPAARRHEIGIEDGLVRLSVGIEAEADLLADLDRALG